MTITYHPPPDQKPIKVKTLCELYLWAFRRSFIMADTDAGLLVVPKDRVMIDDKVSLYQLEMSERKQNA